METIEKVPYFVIDFDSTFTQVEALDELATISLAGNPNQQQIIKQIIDLTNLGMEGKGSFSENLVKRLQLVQANKSHLPQLIDLLRSKVSKSVKSNKHFFRDYADQIYIVSSGFKEFILPIVTEFGIKEDHVKANTFTYDADGNITGCDASNPLSQDKGKIKLMETLGLKGDVHVIGDGYTDYEIRGAGLASKFYAFTENVSRDAVVAKADSIAPNFDEILFQEKLPMSISYPKNRIKVLLLENVHTDAKKLFSEEGYTVETIASGLEEDELIEKIKDVYIIGICSKTIITAKVLEHANKLIAIAAFCIGTN